MTPKYLDHEWVITAVFDTDNTRFEFLKALKEEIRDYWYKQVLQVISDLVRRKRGTRGRSCRRTTSSCR